MIELTVQRLRCNRVVTMILALAWKRPLPHVRIEALRRGSDPRRTKRCREFDYAPITGNPDARTRSHSSIASKNPGSVHQRRNFQCPSGAFVRIVLMAQRSGVTSGHHNTAGQHGTPANSRRCIPCPRRAMAMVFADETTKNAGGIWRASGSPFGIRVQKKIAPCVTMGGRLHPL